MAVTFNVKSEINCTQYDRITTVPVMKQQKSNLLSQLDELNKKEQELLKSLREVEEKKKQIQAQLAQFESPEKSELHEPIQAQKKVEEFIKPYLLVDTTKIMKSKDSKGIWEHYSLCLVSTESEKNEIHKPPINVKKYGSISQVVIDDGTNKTVLKADESYHIQRLIHYFSTDFEIFRKEINAETVDHNGYYSNNRFTFDCQRFSYYLQHGKEGTYTYKWGERAVDNYREAKHTPGSFYSMTGQTPNFGENGKYHPEDYCVHHYMCLTKDIFVSKFGRDEVVFSSFQQILDAYFPSKFTQGNFSQEYY